MGKNYLIDRLLDEKFIENLSNDEIQLYHNWAEKDYRTYLANRSKATHINIFGVKFMPPGGYDTVKKKNRRYNDSHIEERNRVIHNRNFMEDIVKQKKPQSTSRSFDDIDGDPLDYYPTLIQKKHLVFIAQELHLKSSGTVPELIRRLKDNIGKSKRKEVISKILTKMKK